MPATFACQVELLCLQHPFHSAFLGLDKCPVFGASLVKCLLPPLDGGFTSPPSVHISQALIDAFLILAISILMVVALGLVYSIDASPHFESRYTHIRVLYI